MFENVSYTNDASGWSHSPFGSARMRARTCGIAHAGETILQRERGELDVARPGAEHVVLALEPEQDAGRRGSPPAGRSARPASRSSAERSRISRHRSSSVWVCTTENVRRVPACVASRPSSSSSACAASLTSPSMPRGTTSNTPSPRSRSTPRERAQLVLVGEGARHLVAAARVVGEDARRRDAERARVHTRARDVRPSPRGRRASPRRCRRRARPSRTRAPRACGTCVPTSIMRGARSSASRYSGNDSHRQSMPSHSAVPGMSSTPSMSSMSPCSPPGCTGANPTPQLPITTVVTPCQHDGASCESHVAWPS